jgi:hypothetical protein
MQQFFMAVDALIKDFKTKKPTPIKKQKTSIRRPRPCYSYLMFIEHATRTPA